MVYVSSDHLFYSLSLGEVFRLFVFGFELKIFGWKIGVKRSIMKRNKYIIEGSDDRKEMSYPLK